MTFADLLAMADRSVRQDLDGGTITYTTGTGTPVVIAALFDNPYERIDTNVGHAGVQSAAPTVFVAVSDLPVDPTADVGATVTRNAVTYKVTEVKPDGLGGVLLLLQEA